MSIEGPWAEAQTVSNSPEAERLRFRVAGGWSLSQSKGGLFMLGSKKISYL